MSGEKDQPETDAEFEEIEPVETPEASEPTPSEEAIDAEVLEPVTGKASAGPGWLGVSAVGLLAMLGGALLGQLWTPGATLPDDQVRQITSQTQENQTALGAVEAETKTLTAELAALGSRINDLTSAPAAQGDLASLGALTDRIAALESQLGSLASGEAGSPTVSSGTDIAELEARLDALETADAEAGNLNPRLLNRQVLTMTDNVAALTETNSDLQSALAEAETQIEDLLGRIETLEAGLAEAQSAANAAAQGQESVSATAQASRTTADNAIAFSIIESSASRGEPFSLAVQRLTPTGPNDAVVERLREIAPTGAPTLAMLQSDFKALTGQMMALGSNGPTEKKKDGWDWVRRTLGDNVRIERGDDLSSSAIDLSKAEALLDAGDIRGAISELEELPPPYNEVIADWVNKADSRLKLEAALTALRLRMISSE